METVAARRRGSGGNGRPGEAGRGALAAATAEDPLGGMVHSASMAETGLHAGTIRDERAVPIDEEAGETADRRAGQGSRVR